MWQMMSFVVHEIHVDNNPVKHAYCRHIQSPSIKECKKNTGVKLTHNCPYVNFRSPALIGNNESPHDYEKRRE